MTLDRLGARFAALWNRMGAAGDGTQLFDEVIQAYRQPGRHYHGLGHVRDCLEQLDQASAEAIDRDLAETALWFHDAVYTAGATDNEALSAEWAASALLQAGAPESGAREVARLIQLTDHVRPATEPLGALVCDVDLSILGRDPADFADYEARIRAEYASVPEPLYRLGRTKVLTALLARDPLYLSPHFRTRYETAARRNLKRSIEGLRD